VNDSGGETFETPQSAFAYAGSAFGEERVAFALHCSKFEQRRSWFSHRAWTPYDRAGPTVEVFCPSFGSEPGAVAAEPFPFAAYRRCVDERRPVFGM
jgi:hypothetical protein